MAPNPQILKQLLSQEIALDTIFDRLPAEARTWAEGLPWNQRRYVLSLCHLLCASSPEKQAEFLDEYTADGLVSKLLDDYDTKQKVRKYLENFQIETQLNESILRGYIRQFYIHCAQDLQRQPDQYLEVAVRLMSSTKESNHAFNYILGFELLKMMFKMSWQQHERLYFLQANQEEFLNKYIRPIQEAHRINGIIVPKNKRKFFASRDYFVRVPEVKEKKLVQLVMATFPANVVDEFGFGIIRHANALRFDRDYIFAPEPKEIFRADL